MCSLPKAFRSTPLLLGWWKSFLGNIIIILTLRVLIRFTLIRVRHPLMLAGLLILYALASSLILGKILIRWVFYLLILVFLGGVIVILLFMVSICGNEKIFYTKINYKLVSFTLILLLLNLRPLFTYLNQRFKSYQISLPLYQCDSLIMFVIFMLVLLLCMIRVIRVRKLEYGPIIKRL